MENKKSIVAVPIVQKIMAHSGNMLPTLSEIIASGKVEYGFYVYCMDTSSRATIEPGKFLGEASPRVCGGKWEPISATVKRTAYKYERSINALLYVVLTSGEKLRAGWYACEFLTGPGGVEGTRFQDMTSAWIICE